MYHHPISARRKPLRAAGPRQSDTSVPADLEHIREKWNDPQRWKVSREKHVKRIDQLHPALIDSYRCLFTFKFTTFHGLSQMKLRYVLMRTCDRRFGRLFGQGISNEGFWSCVNQIDSTYRASKGGDSTGPTMTCTNAVGKIEAKLVGMLLAVTVQCLEPHT